MRNRQHRSYQIALGLGLLAIAIAAAAPANADAPVRLHAPFCLFSQAALDAIPPGRIKVGVAVYQINRRTLWTAGSDQPFALHSVVKVPLAAAILTEVASGQLQLSRRQTSDLRGMITDSENDAVRPLLREIGGLRGLSAFYRRIGIPEAAAHIDLDRWGRGTATSAVAARIYAAITLSNAVPDHARDRLYELMDAVVSAQRWGASDVPDNLPGWNVRVKTGNYLLTKEEGGAARMNSVAIWFDAAGAPRYTIAILSEGRSDFSQLRKLQRRIGNAIAQAIAAREQGRPLSPTRACLMPILRG